MGFPKEECKMTARFVYRPLSAEDMTSIGNAVIADVKARIQKGQNVADASAKPLKPGRNGHRGYPDYKVARGLRGIRDLVWRGMTMRSIRVIDARPNTVRIGFDNPQAARIAAINQTREAVFWFSPNNRQRIQELVSQAIRAAELVRVGKVA
jgi:hypothetical protein